MVRVIVAAAAAEKNKTTTTEMQTFFQGVRLSM